MNLPNNKIYGAEDNSGDETTIGCGGVDVKGGTTTNILDIFLHCYYIFL